MPPVILIFGSSHVGKSTLANALGARLGWPVKSTDAMGRHPGRPWPDVRKPVAEHYDRLTDETIYWFLKVHQDNIWPLVRSEISAAAEKATGAVFEGSAIRPEFIADPGMPDAIAIGLHATDSLVRERIWRESDYVHQDVARQGLIDKFITRSLRQNAEILETATRLGLPIFDAGDDGHLARYTEALVARLGAG